MFGFSSIVSRRRTKESLEEKIFKKKELEGAADEKNEEQGNKQAYRDLGCLYLVV